MPPRISSRALAQPLLARAYATPVPPAPFTTPVEDTAGHTIHHKGTTSPSSPSSASSSNSISNLIEVDTPFTPARQYPARKQFLNYYYDHLIKTSPLFLLFECDNLSVKDWKKIRNAIQAIPTPKLPFDPSSPSTSSTPTSSSDASSSTSSSENAPSPSKKKKKAKATVDIPPLNPIATMTVLRPGVFSAVARHHSSAQQLVPWLTGQRAILHSQYLSPPYLQQVLQATAKAVKTCKRDGKVKQPKLNLVVGMIEKRLFPAKQIEEVAKLPDLQTLRGQLVGTLEMPGRSLLGVLEQARGGSLVRTLQGLEASMKEKDGGEPST